MNNKSYILQAFMDTPWAILPNTLIALEEIVARHVSGEKLSAEEIEARIHGASRPPERRVNSVAVLPLFGTIFPRANLMTQMSGATSAEIFGTEFTKLLKDPEVGAIVLDINSPGGSVYGVEEVAKKIFDARGQKPIIAVANHLMASAAYWIGSAADEIVVSPSSNVGSIGVFAVHSDWSAALDKEGIKISMISAGKYKVEGNPYQPLDDAARAAWQASVDEVYDKFTAAVARHRGAKPSAVRSGFGEGRVVGAKEAVDSGMADRIATLEDTINRLFGKGGSRGAVATYGSVVVDPPQDGEDEQKGNHSAGQEPTADSDPARTTEKEAKASDAMVHLQAAQERLAQVASKEIKTGETNMLRELLKQREEMLARAQALVDGAEKESRDMNDAEQAEFDEIMGQGDAKGKLGELDARIERVQGDREKLRAAAEKKFTPGSSTEKPTGDTDQKVMKRAEFEKLSPDDKAGFVKTGGKVQD